MTLLLGSIFSGGFIALLFAATIARADYPISSICIEAQTGLIVSEHNADLRRPPASMVKMMPLLLVAEGMRDGKWTLDTSVTITRNVETVGGARVYVSAGEVWPLSHLMAALAVVSANDAAIAVAEALWGSEDALVGRMNGRARELGMIDTEFHSVHGLSPGNGGKPDQSTARDMAILAQWCVLHPIIREWTSLQNHQLRPDGADRRNTNRLLWRMNGCDGLKTGFTGAAGYCVTATAERGGIRLIAVVMGCKERSGRFERAQELLEEGFTNVRRFRVLSKGDAVAPAVRVTNCETAQVTPVLASDLWVTVRIRDLEHLRVVSDQPAAIKAPVIAGTPLGKVEVCLGQKTLAATRLLAPMDLAPASWRWKLKESVLRWRGKAPQPAARSISTAST